MQKSARWVLIVQGVYYFLTGIWPMVSMSSFEAVTGPKIEHWLVRTVGGLAMAVGVVLHFSCRQEKLRPESALLALCAAVAFCASSGLSVPLAGIRPIYLVDAAVQAGFILFWLWAIRFARND